MPLYHFASTARLADYVNCYHGFLSGADARTYQTQVPYHDGSAKCPVASNFLAPYRLNSPSIFDYVRCRTNTWLDKV